MTGWSHEEAKQHTLEERLLERCAAYGDGTCADRKVLALDWCERCLAAHALKVRFYPHRDDDTAAWLKRQRDAFAPGDPQYRLLDDLLEEYRLRADVGATLLADLEPEVWELW